MTATFTSLSLEMRLEPTDLKLADGAFVALVGPNGSGKTSLLHAMAGIAGDATARTIDGEPVPQGQPARRARLIGLMPANRALAWPIPVRDLLSLSPVPVDPERVASLVKRLELTDLIDRPANALSTGERARVFLARTLASRPRLLLLDEPLANLDPYWALSIVDLLREEARGGTMIVTAMHDFALARRFDRMLLMHEGRLALDGPSSETMRKERFANIFRLAPEGEGWRPA
ncbi:ABC transporter ATP-binding protein [Sphingomicrobium clamense]|uniref:ABC transporter ATP-binding protein n=1 Tax=Sphingomicrobium clamense TaxID=2851013 RepID=A0ABS6V6I6_9SPHN|nr:ABC transporter ATP-binding protein [Sphingomicrobium sp. B8]MBW0145183.1 ABC transporter ATP-binding protein [Sphingomicrobium sp. B8]